MKKPIIFIFLLLLGINFSNAQQAPLVPVVDRPVYFDLSPPLRDMVNLGPETDLNVGDEVVLIGKSGSEEITCDEWVEKLGTITYEVTCQINSRVERVYDSY